MKLSLNFLKDYVDLDIDVKTLAEDMTRVGNEYDLAEKLIPATKLVIGKVLECKDHPDSDHLHVCKVDIGTEVLNIVCGAPNVRDGIKVIVALAGADLPNDVKIKKSVIRGEESNGMICALYEIGIDKKFLSEEDKNGIHILPEDAPIGKDPIEYMKLDDSVIDFDLTANRGDLLSILGMAYEVGAIYNKKVKEIDLTHNEEGEDLNKSFEVRVNTDNCKLFLARKALNVEIKESPDFIKHRLIASGIRPINNVVDISNYVMLECGQPLHFYDADRLGNCIEARMADKDEKLTTLDGVERTLEETDIVISDGKRAIGLAGVMGGLDTEIEDETKNVLIEAAIFDSVRVRKTSKKIVRSEASNRFEKGISPDRTYMAIERAVKLLEEYAGAKIQTGTVVYDKTDKTEKEIDITAKDINMLLGTNIKLEDILNVFSRLGFRYSLNDEVIKVNVPIRRLDISIKEDLIEEVGRIYGVDNIVGKLPVVPMKIGSVDKTEREIRNKMISLGLNETLSYILINDKEVHKYVSDEFEELRLLDPMTEDRNTLRYSLIPSLYKIYEYNKAHYIKDVSIFEIGKGFWKKGEEYGEDSKLCALMTGEYCLGINNKKDVDFFIIKGVVEEILDYLGYANRYSFVLPKKGIKEFHPGQVAEINVNGEILGIIGRIHPEISREPVYVFEINLDKLLAKKVSKMKFKEISIYPNIKKDIAIMIDKNITADEISKVIKKAGGNLLVKYEMFDVYTNATLGNKKSVAYSLTFGSNTKTLTDDEVNPILEKIIENLEKTLKAELRK
ncbi:MAG TPA: phenylalanine--tRNA ligase subunit beta [Candidatus Scatovivens faecipullorum]|nr:phenylalanine--tRNA ligase subunit beta [Candidatus Scatovivens faecipullorum]